MKIRQEYTIKGQSWKVKRKSKLIHNGSECYGLCEYESRTIYLERGLKGKKLIETFLHEYIHAVLYEMHLDVGEVIEEAVANGISIAITDLFRRFFVQSNK